MNAEQIKKAILEKKTRPTEPVEPATLLGVEGWLFRASSYQMEGWRQVANAIKPDGSPDDDRRKLSPSKLIQISFRDKENNLVFEDLDLPVIGGMLDTEISPIFKRCLAINGYGGEGIEAILKNLIAITGTDGVYASLVNIGAPCPNCGKGIQSMNSASNTIVNNTGPLADRQKLTKLSSPDKSQDKK